MNLPYMSFDLVAATDDIRAINPSVQVIQASCRTKTGGDEGINWLYEQMERKKK